MSLAEGLHRHRGQLQGSGRRLGGVGDRLQRPNDALRPTRRAYGQRPIGPADLGVVGGEPRHAQDGVVALERSGGERSGERRRGAVGGDQLAGSGDAAGDGDDAPIGESDGAIGGRELEAASRGEGGVDELGRRAAVE